MKGAATHDITGQVARDEPQSIFSRRTNSKAMIAAQISSWHNEFFVDITRTTRDGQQRSIRLWWPDLAAITKAAVASIRDRGEML